MADNLAGTAARRYAVPLSVSTPIIYHTRLIKRIQHRISTILVNLPNRNRTKLQKPPPSTESSFSIDDLIAQSSHVAFWPEGSSRIFCARCHSSFHKNDPKAKLWLQGICSQIGTDTDRPTFLPYESIHKGNKVAHHTNTLMVFKGLVYCNKCGCRGTDQLIKLSWEFNPPTTYGLMSLKALRQGKLPPNCPGWPLP